MAIAPSPEPPLEPVPENGHTRQFHLRDTSHLKQVPSTREERDLLRGRCEAAAAELSKARPLSTEELEAAGRATLAEAGLPDGFLGWTMVTIATAFWRGQVATTPYHRRLFLLPPCLKEDDACPAELGDTARDCIEDRCGISNFRARAQELGYQVMIANDSSSVLGAVVGGGVDAIIGVANLNVLEHAIDKILLAGIPCMAAPLLSSDCGDMTIDDDWVLEMIETPHAAPAAQTKTYIHLMRAAAQLFDPAELDRLAPRQRKSPTLAELNGDSGASLDPVAGTEVIAYDFLSRGGKHSRPFITLAVYDALSGGAATDADGAEVLAKFPDAIKRTAMSIETFHKASLVHDDIEDDDPYRYGEPTLHRRFGVATAINVGDYLIGMGYRLVARDSGALGSDVAADVLAQLADSHMKLAEGQGAELLWRDARDKRLTPSDALTIYALKTAPAFEAAIYAGLRLAEPVNDPRGLYPQFAKRLGVAFQILNDLNDWRPDNHNKLLAGGDVLGGRPTVLWALALEGLDAADRAELEELVAANDVSTSAIARIRQLYEAARAFEKAEALVDKHHQQAESVADQLESEELRRLFHYLVDAVLERPTVEAPAATAAAS